MRIFVQAILLLLSAASAAWAGHPADPARDTSRFSEILFFSTIPVLLGLLFVALVWIQQYLRVTRGTGQRQRMFYAGPFIWSVLAMLCGLAVTVQLAQRLREREQDDLHQHFMAQAQGVASDVEARFKALLHPLNGLRGALVASDPFGRKEFRDYSMSRDSVSEFAGVRGFGYVERVPHAQLPEFERRQRSEGARSFRVHPARDAAAHFVVKFIEPLEANASALGLDVASEETRRSATEQAMRTAQAVMTGPITLVQDPQQRPGAVLYLPVYATPVAPALPAERERLLRGWVSAPVVFAELLGHAAPATDPWVSYQLLSARDGAKAAELLYDSELPSGTTQNRSSSQRGQDSLFVDRIPLSVFGQEWTLKVVSTSKFDAEAASSTDLQAALLGGALSVLLAMVVWLLLAGRVRANDIARTMTLELDRLAKVAQRTSNAVIFSDPDWHITWVNEGFTRITGYTLEEVLGKEPGTLLSSPNADPEVMAHIASVTGSRQMVRTSVLHRRKDGSEYWAELEIQPLTSDAGQLTGYLSIQVDITAERQAQQELLHEKERSKIVLDGTEVGTWESNLITGEQHCNERWCAMMGFTLQEVGDDIDSFWQQRLHSDDQQRLNNALLACVQGKTDRFSVDVRVLHKHGHWMWILSRAKVMSRLPNGRLEWIGGVHTDITDVKLTEIHLRDMEAFLDRAGRIAGVGAWQIDLRSGEMEFSEQTCLLHGLEPGYQPSRDEFLSYYPPHERSRLQAAMELAVAEGKDWDLVLAFRNRHGLALWVRIFGEVEFDDSGAVRMVGAIQDVTRDHAAQQEVERSSALLRGAIDAINEAFVVYDPNDRLVFCNDKYRALYAKSADLMVPGASFESIVRGGAERGQYIDALGRVDEWVAERLVAHQAGNTSAEQRLDDGRWLKVVERRMPDGHLVGFRVDITEIKRATEVAEQASARLADEQRRLQNILEGTNVGTWEWNVQSGEAFYNDQWATMLGYTLAALEPLGYDTWTRLAHPEDLLEASRKLHAHIQGQSSFFEAEVRMQHKQGGWRWVLARGKLSRWLDDGRPLWVSGTHMDITERKHAERALADTMATLQSVLDSALNVGIISTDNERRIRVFNKGAENLLGYRAADMLGTTDSVQIFEQAELAVLQESLALMLGHPPDMAEVMEHLGEHREPQEWTFVRKDGSKFKGSAIFSPMHDIQGRRIGQLAILNDISKQKEYEDSLREAMRLAEQSSVAKGQFLANMSHEIRTPMNAILGMLQLLHNTPLSPRQRDYTEKTEGAARSLLGLLNDILDFSKVEAGKMQLDPEPFMLDTLLGDLSVILSANLGDKNVDLLFEVDPLIPHELIGDSLRLKQILINLGGNAVKFTDKGEVLIRWKLVTHTAERVRVAISVSDTGIGIAPENQARIFEAFTQAESNTTRRFGGTGLGLVISTRLIHLMGGELKLESALGRGTTFSFILEFALPALGTRADWSVSARAGAVPRVLLVDDNPTARANSLGALKTLGWEVVTAASGQEALDLLKSEMEQGNAAFDAAFVDWQMPGMDGWETLRGIRRLYGERQRPKLIMLSRQSREALARRTGREQELLDALAVKPLTAAMFRQAYNDAHNRNLHVSGADAQAPEGPGRLAGMNILLVEDNPINQQVARELLACEGARVTLADNGRVGVDAVLAGTTAFDAVLMDLQMPVMDGMTAASLLRQQKRFDHLPIIAMTANAMASDREACLAVGMNDHVGKPFDLHALVRTLCKHTHWQLPAETAPSRAGRRDAAPGEPAAQGPGATGVVQGIDLATALARMGGNRNLLLRTYAAFVADSAHLPDRYAALLESHDHAALKRELHSLKGLAGTLGAADLSASAAAAEKACAEPVDAAVLRTCLQGLYQGLQQCLPALQSVMGLLEADSAPAATAVAASLNAPAADGAAADAPDAHTMEQLTQLLDALRRSDMTAMEIHAELRQAVSGATAERMEPLDAAMADLDFDSAAQACANLVTLWSK